MKNKLHSIQYKENKNKNKISYYIFQIKYFIKCNDLFLKIPQITYF